MMKKLADHLSQQPSLWIPAKQAQKARYLPDRLGLLFVWNVTAPPPWTSLFANLEYDKKQVSLFVENRACLLDSIHNHGILSSSRNIEWITRKMKGLLTINYITAWSMVILVQNKSSIHPTVKKIWGMSWCRIFLRQIYENELSCG